MKRWNTLCEWLTHAAGPGFLLLTMISTTLAQQAAPPTQAASMDAAIHELQQQVQELRAAVAEIHSEAAQYRAETAELRRQLETTQAQLAAAGTAAPEVATSPENRESEPTEAQGQPPARTLEQRVASLEESSQMLNGKIDDQYQTKVSSASKYRVRLSGLALLNVFSNRGATDNQSVPSWARPSFPFDSAGNFGASMNQSQLGLEVFGPTVGGARISGGIQVDFSGGFPDEANGVNFGLVRLRTANMRLDWKDTSIVAGQDGLFLSPQNPTSFASLAEPAFSYAGNLWGWIPQVRVEHRFVLSDDQQFTIQGGILDNVTGEPPYDTTDRTPQAGERSSQPAFGTRIAWTHSFFGHPATFGAAGYYSRQNWVIDHHVDGWAGMADWDIPLGSRVSLSGEFYRGLSVGGFGGGIGRSALYSDDNFGSTTQVRGLQSEGGWAQLKVRATSKLEFNGAFGLDNPFAEYLRDSPHGQSYLPLLSQNRSSFVNFIYRPRSNLLFSTEYRHLKTYGLDGPSWTAEQLNLIMGVLF
ncbi:MAG TPA: hypothetical protein VH437_24860 [Terriglobales bacterium]